MREKQKMYERKMKRYRMAASRKWEGHKKKCEGKKTKGRAKGGGGGGKACPCHKVLKTAQCKHCLWKVQLILDKSD